MLLSNTNILMQQRLQQWQSPFLLLALVSFGTLSKAYILPPLKGNTFNRHPITTSNHHTPRSRCSRSTVNIHLHLSSNPNDLETAEERVARMNLVRQLQKSFYVNETGISAHSHGVFSDIPLWRVQWTELPGFQNVLNVWQPHYTHMFMKIVTGPKPWYFGHVYLPGGTDNLDNQNYFLTEGTEAPTTGCLMQVADYSQEEDGRLTIIVQAMEKFRVVEPSRHVPYSIATVALEPDEELLKAQYEVVLSKVGDSDVGGGVWGGSRAAAVAEAMYWHPFEYRHVPLEKTPTPAGPVIAVSPLVNFDGKADVFAEEVITDEAIRDALDDYLEHNTKNIAEKEYDIESMSDERDVAELEYRTWVELDRMIRLLTKAAPYQEGVPIPTQMMGLMPHKPPAPHEDWPTEFALHKFVTELDSDRDAMVGTASRSPFVHVDSDRGTYGAYPGVRRAQRLSFVIWTLLEQILVQGEEAMSRQVILEMSSIAERLRGALDRMRKINTALNQMILEQGN